MIYLEMDGRTGNQLFRYAFARRLMLETGDKQLTISFNSVDNANVRKPGEGFVNYLQDFKVAPYRAYRKNGFLLVKETNLFQKLLVVLYEAGVVGKGRIARNKYQNRFHRQQILNFFGIYWAYDKGTVTIHKRRKQIVSGSFEWPGYFDSIRTTLLKEFQPKAPVQEKNIPILKSIQTTDSVCISVRRGDFFSPGLAKSLGVCTKEYYMEAVKILEGKRKESENIEFFIFSDDIEWCKKELTFPSLSKFNYISQDMPVYETLRLMYSCKHFIISNSTFSWWGQYLSRNPEKVVISPSKWNTIGFDSPLISKDWILIDPDKL